MKRIFLHLLIVLIAQVLFVQCTNKTNNTAGTSNKIPVIFDTDANNELDDQHALAYLLCNGNTFHVEGVTVNTTRNGGMIDEHYAEAERVIKLYGVEDRIPLYKGADGSFEEIKSYLDSTVFDGSDAVNFIIEAARKYEAEPLVLIAVGKLTNVALAVKKDPSIIKNIKLVWLGSNYPDPGEYNLDNDIPSMNYLLETDIPFEMVTVRYGKSTGTDAVKVTPEEIKENMPGLGPKVSEPVIGRHGGSFTTFGDYSVSLFAHAKMYGDPPSRALFDMAAVAIVKNPAWADSSSIPAPTMVDGQWVEQPDNERKIVIWENFKKDEIMEDFFGSMREGELVE